QTSPYIPYTTLFRSSEISRGHHLQVSESGLVTIAGGKWTTYRKMVEDTVDRAAVVAGLERKDCPTKNLRIHGWLKNVDRNSHLFVYGSDLVKLRELIEAHPTWEERLQPDYPYMKADDSWAEIARAHV